MKLQLSTPPNPLLKAHIQITGSKSETNRLLLLQSLFPNLKIKNLSNSDDAKVMQNGLATSNGKVDIHHAGTAMRFLTAYFASQQGKNITLTGSERMRERPIKILVDALKFLGADIQYANMEGYPPLIIKGKHLSKRKVALPADVSSQYISALLLIAPSLEHGLEMELMGKITSVPYIEMTLGLLKRIGVDSVFEGNKIRINPKKDVVASTLVVESDWSAASYFYSLVAMAKVETKISLGSYKKDSLQGDRVLSTIYRQFGVETTFLGDEIVLSKESEHQKNKFDLDLSNAPDIAQTIAVTCLGLGIDCHLTGLHTLPIKETDRLAAMKTELEKLGGSVTITDKSLSLKSTKHVKNDVAIDTYNDHRMAMAFGPIALKTDVIINEAEVVSKSYPDFWEDLNRVGIAVKTL